MALIIYPHTYFINFFIQYNISLKMLALNWTFSNLQIIYNIQSEISRIFNPKCLEYLEHGHLLGNRCIFSASLVFLKLCCSFELKYDREDIKKGVFS